MARKKWFTEEQLCDLLEARVLESTEFKQFFSRGAVTLLREYEIAHKLRPDFVCYTRAKNYDKTQHRYDVFEVKINADVDSVAQIANYLWLFEAHHRHVSPEAQADLGNPPYIFAGHLLARSFDKSVYSLAEVARIQLWRITPNDNGILVEREPHIHQDSPLDSSFVEVLSQGDPVRMKSPKRLPMSRQALGSVHPPRLDFQHRFLADMLRNPNWVETFRSLPDVDVKAVLSPITDAGVRKAISQLLEPLDENRMEAERIDHLLNTFRDDLPMRNLIAEATMQANDLLPSRGLEAALDKLKIEFLMKRERELKARARAADASGDSAACEALLLEMTEVRRVRAAEAADGAH